MSIMSDVITYATQEGRGRFHLAQPEAFAAEIWERLPELHARARRPFTIFHPEFQDFMKEIAKSYDRVH